jgi:2-iminobutanoate/2-iminopropanoate deaminase
MNRKLHCPTAVAAPVGGYAHGLEIDPGARYLFISGQVPERQNGEVPAGFADQCHAVWDNIFAILAAAEMGPEHLVKVTTYLTSPDQAETNSQIRQQRLGAVKPALTVLVVQTLEARWLLEIEAIAAAEA